MVFPSPPPGGQPGNSVCAKARAGAQTVFVPDALPRVPFCRPLSPVSARGKEEEDEDEGPLQKTYLRGLAASRQKKPMAARAFFLFAVVALTAAFAAALPAGLDPAPPTPPVASPRSLVVLGDSLSDDGNTFRLTNGTWPPSPPYARGVFSDGPVWAQVTADLLGVRLDSAAYGGATTDNRVVVGKTGPGSNVTVPSVSEQADTVFGAGGSEQAEAPARGGACRALAVFAGGNDLYFDGSATGAAAAARLVGVVASVGDVRSCRLPTLIFELPPLEAVPALAGQAELKEKVGRFSREFNAALRKELARANLAAAGACKQVRIFPTFEFFKEASARFPDSRSACLNTTTMIPCDRPDQHVFWDQFHFSTAFGAFLGAAVRNHLWYGQISAQDSVSRVIKGRRPCLTVRSLIFSTAP
ncbi:MAG: hypothetical protein BJ554DRAFT_4194 [Olpidium bornovanus]|uniref:Uncharacterized protein n=1 Tax=Olpidium bornovanus TaxID=278681 RepID=A0A8H7ZN33_9FUNG|nr:MAG: hypothetical protein BJ554DRAFT_4194 [Olpidium bornovanus]